MHFESLQPGTVLLIVCANLESPNPITYNIYKINLLPDMYIEGTSITIMKSEQLYGILWPSFFYWIFKKIVHKKSHQDSDTQGMYKNRVEKDKKFLLQIPALSYFQWGNSVENGILNFPNLDFLIHNIFLCSLPSFYIYIELR